MISYIIPTRDRPERLKATLHRLAALGNHASVGGAEVIVVDNDSGERLIPPTALNSGLSVRTILLPVNMGAAARNIGAAQSDPASGWLVMLDDDSYPLDTGHLRALSDAGTDVGAIGADIFLPTRARGVETPGPREAGGLPEVFVGCGVAIRRSVFLETGGYDPAMGYYAEEYDLCARLLLAGWRVRFDPRFKVLHAKVRGGRNMDLILSRLVRNNGWVAQRYAPESARVDEIRRVRQRYRDIAEKERALRGYAEGLAALRATLRTQQRQPLSPALWDRFTGLATARSSLASAFRLRPFLTAAIVEPGRNAWVVAQALRELGVRLTSDGEDAQALVIGAMSRGPMLDAYARLARWAGPHSPRVLLPWNPASPEREARLAA